MPWPADRDASLLQLCERGNLASSSRLLLLLRSRGTVPASLTAPYADYVGQFLCVGIALREMDFAAVVVEVTRDKENL